MHKLPITAAKNHWGRWLDRFVFSIFGKFLTWDKIAASNSPTLFSSKRYAQFTKIVSNQ